MGLQQTLLPSRLLFHGKVFSIFLLFVTPRVLFILAAHSTFLDFLRISHELFGFDLFSMEILLPNKVNLLLLLPFHEFQSLPQLRN